jgi:hypothetical protein
MKKYPLSSLVIGLSLVILPAFSYAQDVQGSPINNSDNIRQQIGEKRQELGDLRDMKNAYSTDSTSTPRNHIPPGQLRNKHGELRVDIFKLQQNHITQQLTRALDNLRQVRSRIEARITQAETDGKDMTSVNALLATADTKILTASSSIDTFLAYTPPTPNAISSENATSTNINLDKPRIIGASAIQAVKDAKDALNDVVVALAHSLGLKLENDNASTTSTQ